MSRVSLALMLAFLAAPKPAGAEPHAPSPNVAEAQGHFRRGIELYEESNLAAALVEMKRAYQLAPSFRILYDIGQIQFEMQNYAGALAAFQDYVAEGAKEIPVERRRQVEKDIAKLKQRIALVEVAVNVPDAEIWIDDERVGTAPLGAPLSANPGRRKIMVAKWGYATAQRLVEVAGGDAVEIKIELAQERPSPILVVPPPAAEKKNPEPARMEHVAKSASRAPANVWIGWTATGVLAAGSGVLAFLAWRAAADVDKERNRFGTTGAVLDQKRTRFDDLALGADVCLATTAAAAGLTLVWTWVGSHPHADSARVGVKLSASSLTVDGAF